MCVRLYVRTHTALIRAVILFTHAYGEYKINLNHKKRESKSLNFVTNILFFLLHKLCLNMFVMCYQLVNAININFFLFL